MIENKEVESIPEEEVKRKILKASNGLRTKMMENLVSDDFDNQTRIKAIEEIAKLGKQAVMHDKLANISLALDVPVGSLLVKGWIDYLSGNLTNSEWLSQRATLSSPLIFSLSVASLDQWMRATYKKGVAMNLEKALLYSLSPPRTS